MIGTAYANGQAAAPAGFDFISLLPMVVIFVLFYFMLIRPQQKKMKEHQNMLANLQKGDEVSTNGGLVGKVVKLSDQYVVIEVADKVEMTLQRPAITAVLPKGTLKNI
ncbi:preprotein translocase subunit YajC [Chitinivorax tropicus]|uniref:Sec translocon accessory complex subunit YajC n=1 Tax=Chitinivorax tropicus TaxID=714531 RepID=A0A840MT70_9PROT|nr:preprotein translocase subunit YajC [Chitinivorax tropicus]MBB5020279.1 preprotein translocase subunit YajC [Chitinivorax tropicus]